MAISAGDVSGIGSNIGGAVGDLFAAQGAGFKAQGDRMEAQEYGLAAGLADQNEKFTEQSTAIKQFQTEREIQKSLGQTTADVAGAGFASSGSSLDILRDSASQGSLAKSVLGEQGLITEAGYKEQGDSYRLMQGAANIAADAENNAAKGDMFGGILKGVTAVAGLASMFIPGAGAVADLSQVLEGGAPLGQGGIGHA